MLPRNCPPKPQRSYAIAPSSFCQQTQFLPTVPEDWGCHTSGKHPLLFGYGPVPILTFFSVNTAKRVPRRSQCWSHRAPIELTPTRSLIVWILPEELALLAISQIRTHTKEKSYHCHHCEYCQKRFGMKDSLAVHVGTHFKEKPWVAVTRIHQKKLNFQKWSFFFFERGKNLYVSE